MVEEKKMKHQIKRRLYISPVQTIVLGFFLLIVVGTILLMMPFSAQVGQKTQWIDAFFVATSAVCVTGLSPLNTAEHWSPIGQVIIMILIELGGLGFLTVATIFFSLLRKKASLSVRMLYQEALNVSEVSGVFRLMKYIMKFAAIIQLLGAFLLSFQFVPTFGWKKGLFFSLFHAVSAFCNAGFDLLGDSMVPYQNSPYLLLVISFLIIAGGLGFIVWRDIFAMIKGYKNKIKHRVSIHTRLALTVTATFLVLGTVIFYISEYRHFPADMSFWQRLVNSWFLSVTPRTAGFYSVDYLKMSNPGLIVTILWMFIGGTSGSTAGGLKTTTFGVLFLQFRAIFKGKQRVEFHERTIPERVVLQAFTLFFLATFLCVTASVILSFTETLPLKNGIEYIVFEVISAFGTVGLTMGLTPDLTVFGKLVIIFLMFVGRVGVYTVLLSLIKKGLESQSKVQYPKESVMIG
ncbi:TPA: TrkH family potassium uptake protein [Enterococcus faecalis]